MKKLTKLLAGSWVILSLMTAFPGIVNASGNLTIVVKNPNPYTGNQSWFTYQEKPGASVDDIATVKNLSNQPVKAHVYAVDATSNDSGSFILKLENEARNDVGKWTTISAADTVTIPPQQTVDFPFHIKVPQTATPGQYFGGIVLEEVSDKPQVAQVSTASANTGKTVCCTNILVKTRIGLRIYLTIPGTVKDSMDWSGFSTVEKNKITNFQFEIKNTGNVALEPIATLQIYDSMGNQVDEFQKSLGESLPGTSINAAVPWDNQPLFGNFHAVAKLDYTVKSDAVNPALHGSANVGSKTVSFNVMSWNLVGLIFLCLLAGAIGYFIYAHSQNQIRMDWEPYEVQPNDNIMNIAKSHGIDWKKLVHVNKLKAPYIIKNGEKLRVPKIKTSHQPSLFDKNKHE